MGLLGDNTSTFYTELRGREADLICIFQRILVSATVNKFLCNEKDDRVGEMAAHCFAHLIVSLFDRPVVSAIVNQFWRAQTRETMIEKTGCEVICWAPTTLSVEG